MPHYVPRKSIVSSLRKFLNELPNDELLVIDESISPHFVPTALVLELERRSKSPVVYIPRPKGFDVPIVTNLFGDQQRIARMAGGTWETFDSIVLQAENHPLPPQGIVEGACQEIVSMGGDANAEALPVSKHFEADAGPYVGSGILVSRDPDTNVRNLSFQRLQLKGPRKFGVSLHSRGHIWDYLNRARNRGESLEVAVVIGAHPSLYLAASARVAMETDEYDIAGGLLGEPVRVVPCRTVDLEVPAEAEIILEGEILADVTEPEGPFAEYPGYSTDRSTRNVFEVRAITRRENPLFLDLIPGNSSEHLQLAQTTKRAHILARLREVVPQVKQIHYPKSGTNFHAYVQLHKTAEGQARHALMLLFGLDHYTKLAVAVDDDIDVFDEGEVFWAIATRMQADQDTFVVPKVFHNRLDPSGMEGMSAKMGIDATAPSSWTDIQRVSCPDSARRIARRLLDALSGSPQARSS